MRPLDSPSIFPERGASFPRPFIHPSVAFSWFQGHVSFLRHLARVQFGGCSKAQMTSKSSLSERAERAATVEDSRYFAETTLMVATLVHLMVSYHRISHPFLANHEGLEYAIPQPWDGGSDVVQAPFKFWISSDHKVRSLATPLTLEQPMLYSLKITRKGPAMSELIARHEAIENQVEHFGKSDPNLVIYNYYRDSRQHERAERFLRYRQEWESVRGTDTTPDRPLHFSFALCDRCNLTCPHCYRAFRDTKKERRASDSLDFGLFRSIVDQCKELDVPSILLGAEAEAFLYDHVKEAIAYVGSKDFVDFWLITNGQLLSGDHADLILDSGVTRLEISIDAFTSATYAKVRGKRFFRLLSNIFTFLDKRERKGMTLPILRVSFVKYKLNEHEADAFVNFWRNFADEVDCQTIWDASNVDVLQHTSVETPKCLYPNNMLNVNWKGDFKPCCLFYNRHLVLGNASKMTVAEAWNSPLIQSLRRQFKGEEPLNRACVNCSRSRGVDEV